ncbi:hypothetical protein BTS2_3834 [Bacillus sp. TS-2]|nr:hypothetical protein BTS2_3834 [Bacillus sp. TS-2]
MTIYLLLPSKEPQFTPSSIFDYAERGMDNLNRLNDAEKLLAIANPAELVINALAARDATQTALYHYSVDSNHHGNGDALRHSLWNAYLVNRFNSNVDVALIRAEFWATAHEVGSTGLDLQMDLINNEIGRQYGYMNFGKSDDAIRQGIVDMVRQGSMVRLIQGKLYHTDGDYRR